MSQEQDQMMKSFATRAIHVGEEPDPITGAHNPPIYQTSTFVFDSLAEKFAFLEGEREGYIYSRVGNPTARALERKMASLEGAEDSLAAASGMGVISATLLSHLSAGDHFIASDDVYYTASLFIGEDLPRLGIEATPVRISDLDAVRAAIRPNTRLIYTEFLSNPLLVVADIPALAEIARENDLMLVVDNTFASPYLYRPIEDGADLVIHSATKYISGHGDTIAGIVSGKAELIERARTMASHLGAPIAPFNAWLLMRGLKTLELRMERHCSNAQALAEYLTSRPEVVAVHYPGLPGHENHDVAKRLLGGKFSGMLSFEIEGGDEAGQQFADALELCGHGVSLGDVSTLVWPWPHREVVRVSAGVEGIDDIIADFEEAFRRIG